MIIARKLNTKSFTGRDLVEKLYSEGWEVEQREYGIGSTVNSVYNILAKRSNSIIKHTKNRSKNLLETFRSIKKLGPIKGIKERKLEDIKKLKNFENKLKKDIESLDKQRKPNNILIDNKEAKDELKKVAESRKIDVYKGNIDRHMSKNDYIDVAKNSPISESKKKEIIKDIKKDPNNDYISLVDFDSGKSPEILAHEMGHVETGKVLKNPIDAYTKWRSKGREANKFREFTSGKGKKKDKIDDKRDYKGLGGYFRLKRRNRGVNNVLMEEENASKNARKDLKDLVKKNKMTESEYNKASENLDNSLKTYKDDAKIYKDYAKLKRNKK